ncbi:TonB-dependent receptor [Echinicola sp. 20G]|uniref:TonB-dependent receptor n=1 Tax=Echinicola sp. 20G TaxID=2781961 RepID=UPI00190FFC6C|nr:TonB-dependent receptor [Echinicola sp. 20G]
MKNILHGLIMIGKYYLYGFALQLLFLNLLHAMPTKAQGSLDMQKVYVNLNLSEGDLSDVLHEIERQSDFIFVYDDQTEKETGKVSLSVKNQTLESALYQLAAQNGLSFKQVNNRISVKKSIPNQPKLVEVVREEKVKGTVLDDIGYPLPGATVLVKGTTSGTVTNLEGEYEIDVNQGDVLVFSFVGFSSQEVTYTGQSSIDITMSADETALDEVVVVGYGTQKKINLTGAVSAVGSEEVSRKPVGQVSSALQGVAPGLTVTQRSGQPGADQGTLRIRGIGTLNSNDPLVLVDGVQYDINDIDANDIESISVLKDAAAASIYGVRAANGVVLITTKRGKDGKPRISYNNYFGVQEPTRMTEFVGAKDFMQLVNTMYANSGAGAIYSDNQIAAYDDPNRDPVAYPDNYWLDKVLTGSGFQQSHSLAISGGQENVTYRVSTNYFDQKGLIENMDFDRFTLRVNTDIKASEKVNFSADISANISNREEPQGVSGSAWYQFGQAAIINPLTPAYYSNGEYAVVRGGQNPLRLQDEGGIYSYKQNLFTGNFQADYEVIEGLKLTGRASINYQSDYTSLHEKQLIYNVPESSSVVLGRNEVTKQSLDYWFKNFQGLANYSKNFGENHNLHVLAGISSLLQTNESLTGYRTNIPNGNLSEIDAGASDGQEANGTANEYALLSFFGRVNYAFKDKYLVEANIRRDGSSRFADGQKWGIFPSFSLGWRISDESFMEGLGFVDDLKLRGSWGMLGNDAIGNYPYQTSYSFNDYPFGGTLNQAAGLSAYPNSQLSWETTKMTDVGFDLVILQGKMDFTFDYYVKNTDDILLQLPIPSTVGLSAPYQNVGSVENKGWEFSANYHGRAGSDFTYDIGANFSDVKNEITDFGDADYLTTDNNDITTAYQVGYPIGAFFGYISDGIFQSADEVAQHATQPGSPSAGDLIYRDVNGDGEVNTEDRVYLGSNIPRYTYGLNLNAAYKGFSIAAFFQGVAKADINTLVLKRAPTSTDGNFRDLHLDSWTPENTDASFPRLTTAERNYQSSSYWVESGAYVRLKTLQLNYNLPKSLLEPAKITRARVFVTGQNLFTLSGLENDIDPEAPNDNRYYPQVKTYTVGLSVEF